MSEVKRFGYFWDGSFDVKDDGAFIRYEDYAELKAQRDALAAENAALKSAIADYAKVKQDFDDFDGDRRGMAESLYEAEGALVSSIKTPATDAYLNSVLAEGIEILTGKLQQLIDEGVFDAKEIGVAAGAVHEGAQIAAKLRAGKDGEV